MSRDKFRKETMQYIEEIYKSHRETDVEAWRVLIEVILDYIDESIRRYCKDDKTE